MPMTLSINTLQRSLSAQTQLRLNVEQQASTEAFSYLASQPLEFNQDGECTNSNVKESILAILKDRFFSGIETFIAIFKNAFTYQDQFNKILQEVETARGEPLIIDDFIRSELAYGGITLIQDDAGLVKIYKSVPLRQQEISNSIGEFVSDENTIALISSYDSHSIYDDVPTPTEGEFIEDSIAYLDQLQETAEDQVKMLKSLLNELEQSSAKTDKLSVNELRLLAKIKSVFS